MVRWLNTFIEDAKVVERGLIQVLGIGQARTKTLCRAVGIAPTTKVGDLRPWHWDQMAKEIHTRGWSIQEELKKEVYDNIVRLQRMKHRRGYRHALALPTRGQRTRWHGNQARRAGNRGEKMDMQLAKAEGYKKKQDWQINRKGAEYPPQL
mmetsp:Transcript_35218/g.139942  ORF Transcript_35218/g.139942 Transcript_35218/m.139942 type:complete len:151 (-) Transcript_35218:238-690(-)